MLHLIKPYEQQNIRTEVIIKMITFSTKISQEILKNVLILLVLSGCVLSILQAHDLPRAQHRVTLKNTQNRCLCDTERHIQASIFSVGDLNNAAAHYKATV